MSAMTILFYLIMIVLAAIIGDHYIRLKKMGWAPQTENYKRGALSSTRSGARWAKSAGQMRHTSWRQRRSVPSAR